MTERKKVEILKFLDKWLGGFILLLIGGVGRGLGFIKDKDPSSLSPRKILLIKLVGMGDLVLALPTFKAIKERFPQAELWLFTTPRGKEVVERHSWIEKILLLEVSEKNPFRELFRVFKEIKKERFDLSVDLEHYYFFPPLLTLFSRIPHRAGFFLPKRVRSLLYTLKVPYQVETHELKAFGEVAKLLGKKIEERLIPFPLREEEEKKVARILKKYGLFETPWVIIHPGTSSTARVRRWRPQRWAEVIRWLKDKRIKTVLTGRGEEREVINSILEFLSPQEKKWVINLVDGTSLGEFASLIKKTSLFLSVDTGPLHLASSMETRILGLFGPNTPLKWGPWGEGNHTIYKNFSCSPCTKQWLGKVCRCSTGECMDGITSQEVIEKIKQILQI